MARSDALKRLGLGFQLPEYDEEDLNQVPLKPASDPTIEDVPDEMAAKKSGLMETQPKLTQLKQEQALEGTPLIGRPSLTEEDLPEIAKSLPTPPESLKSPEERYSAALKAASAAGPTQEDYRAAAIRRAFAEQRAGMPAYLQQMSTTLFNKPDFSGQAAAARAGLEAPEYEIKGKEAEQKRLQDVAEGIRKEALLPTEMAEKKAKSLKTEAEIKALESKGAPLPEVRRKLYEAQINRFITKNKLGEPMQLPEGITESDAGRLFMAAQKGDTTDWRNARLDFDREKLAFQREKELGAEERRQLEREEKGIAKELSFEGLSFKGRTEKEAQELRGKIAATNSVYAGMDKIKQTYGEIPTKKLSEIPKAVQDIGVRGRDLIMQIKEVYGLGAPQEGELKFLYSLIESGEGPLGIGKAILSDKIVGTSLPDKLDSLRDQFNTFIKAQIEAKAVPSASSESTKPGAKRVQQPPAKPSTPTTKPARKVITDPNEL